MAASNDGFYAGMAANPATEPPYGFPEWEMFAGEPEPNHFLDGVVSLLDSPTPNNDREFYMKYDPFIVEFADHLRQERKEDAAKKRTWCKHFTSVDPGFANGGISHGTATFTELKPGEFALELSVRNHATVPIVRQDEFDDSRTLFEAMQFWVIQNEMSLFGESCNNPDVRHERVVLLEHQYFQPRGALATVSHKLKQLEFALFSEFYRRGFDTQVIYPRMVKQRFDTSGGDNATNKRLAVQYVRDHYPKFAAESGMTRQLDNHEVDTVLQALHYFCSHIEKEHGGKVVKTDLVVAR